MGNQSVRVSSWGYTQDSSPKFQVQSSAGIPSLRDLMPDELKWSDVTIENKVHNECSALESSRNQPTSNSIHRKIVFLKTGPWCQKGWGPLV